jgi:hypothetical protein
MARKGDVVVLQADNVKQVIQDVMEYKENVNRSTSMVSTAVPLKEEPRED